jgi:hypothetical protein
MPIAGEMSRSAKLALKTVLASCAAAGRADVATSSSPVHKLTQPNEVFAMGSLLFQR